MTKSELIKRLSSKYTRLKEAELEALVNLVLGEISDALVKNERVELRGFGAFSIRERAPRQARNPRTGAKVTVGARKSVYYRAGKELKDFVNA